MNEHISNVASKHGLNVDALQKAHDDAIRLIAEFCKSLRKALETESYAGIDVLVCGSFARREITRESDCDYLILVDELSDHRIVTRFMSEVERLREENSLAALGKQGTFGDFVTSTELMARIGLEADSNNNMTRRLLFLTESVSVYQPEIRSQVIDKVLSRYCADYLPDSRPEDYQIGVPRFLVNDLVRFWRTMAVDFGAKRWRSLRPDWYLRFAKLITTRKVLFAGSLTAAFLSERVLQQPSSVTDDAYKRLIFHLKEQFDMPPLARLLAAYEHVDDDSKRSLADILDSYNRFIEILNTRNARNLLMRADATDEKATALRQEIDKLGNRIQLGLEQVFFKDKVFQGLTLRYGLF